ncbi:MAG: C40 family peptidase [Pseudonocardia sp.]|nr:C40 family peptidase [Pseudonocardia sp.]
MPIHPLSSRPATQTRSTRTHRRGYATRAAVVATTSAAAALLSVLPSTAAAPAAAAAPATVSARAVSAPVVSVPVVPAAASVPTHATTSRSSAVANALSKVGAAYRWGGDGPSSFDCSGLVNWAFEKVGVDLPRTSRALSQVGTPVSRNDLKPGDLVFFYSPVSHVGIYIGDGQMVHASTSGKPVAVDPIEGREYHSARRVA